MQVVGSDWLSKRRWPLATSAVITALCLVQAPGRLGADTKLDLVVAPVRFLGRALRMWQPEAAFGHIQNQSVGYLFPTGPFFAIGHTAGLPMWVVQRLWMATLLVVALWGALRVAEALGIGTAASRLAGAITYALSPAMLVVIGFTSGGQVPAALLPWALLPLIGATAAGSTRRAAARSALAVAAMGGINAGSTISVLLLPALWLVAHRGPRARALWRWWLLAVPMACLWWLLPLLLQARYGTNFLAYTESADTTTATASATDALRGTGYWLAHLFSGGRPWLPGGWALASVPIAIAASVAVATGGLWGLARRDLPERAFLLTGAAVGFVAVVAGYGGPLGGGLDGFVRDLLDGPFGAFRNVTKFEPVLRLPLALGLAHALGVAAGLRLSPPERVAAGAVVLALVAAAAWPLARAETVPPGSFERIPAHWEDAAAWLEARAGTGRTLLTPSSAFAEYEWGRPLDEPLQPLAGSPWAVRDLVPLGGEGLTRLLDEVDARLARGDAGPGFAPGLARAGVRYLVVRNDLDASRTASPSPVKMRDALAMAPGMRLVRSFGPTVDGRSDTDRLGPPNAGPARYRALDIYELADWAGPIATYPATPTVLSGGPENIFDVADRGAVVLAGDDARGADVDSRVVTDGLRRRDVGPGDVRLTASYVLTADEPAPGTSRPPRDRLPVPGVVHQSRARMTGAVTLRASSYGSPVVRVPELQPYAAFDGDAESAWVAQGPDTPLGEWIEVGLSRAVDPRRISVRVLSGPRWSQITHLRVTTERGAVTSRLTDADDTQSVAVPPGATRSIRIQVVGIRGRSSAGLREVDIPGVTIERSVRLPTDQPGGRRTAWHLRRAAADPYDATRADEEPRLRRIIAPSTAVRVAISGTARGRPGPGLDALLDGTGSSALTVGASSVWKSLPAFHPRGAWDGDPTTAWIADPDDETPALTLRWPGPRTLDRVDVVPTARPARRPTRLRLLSPEGERLVRVPASGTARFPALSTSTVVVEVLESAPVARPRRGLVTRAAAGIAELRFPALADLAASGPSRSGTLELPCGEGPPVLVDGRTVPTRAHGSVEALRSLRPLTVEACAPVRLTAAEHRVEGGADGPLVIDSLVLAAKDTTTPEAAVADRSARVVTWDAEDRRVAVGRGGVTWLTLTENFNDGWRATLDGRTLETVRVDGWRQGFVVPAGPAGTVRLTFGPGRAYKLGLALGVVALVVLTLAAVRRGEAAGPPAVARRLTRPVVIAVALATGFVAGGFVVLVAGAVLAVLARHITASWIAAAYAVAGAVAVVQPGRFPTDHAGSYSPVAQGLSVLAVACLVLTLTEEQ